ncbi:MAG: DDE transposase family protein [Limnospira sp.]
MPLPQNFYIVKRPAGTCDILSGDRVDPKTEDPDIVKCWGSFDSSGEAIARRVGLIRAGQCRPQ